MTDFREIEVPEGDADETARASDAPSLIERAVGGFDLSRMAPPVPADLAAQPERLARRKARLSPDAATAEAKSARAAVPDAGPAPKLTPAPHRLVFSGESHAIERARLREQGFIVPDGPTTELLEEFRIVKRQLLLHAADLARRGGGAAAQRVLISSPLPREGKTFCAINLALSIAAEMESEVLLVDADFAQPSVLSTLGLPGGPGLMDALVDPAIDVADCVIVTDIPGLFVLPAGSATNSDAEYLASSRTSTVLDRLTEGAPNRVVIFDSPPALAASPAADLARYVGQAVMVVRADSTGQGALDDAVSLLGACPNIQLLLNGAHFSPTGRRFGSYHENAG